MNDKMLLIDIDRCVRCFACEVACKQQNDLPVGTRWNYVVTVEPRKVAGELHTDFVFTTCVQCDDPVCVLVCPANAISKREDGIVIIDEAKCNGCGICVGACPYGAVRVNPEKKVAWKCSQCTDRMDQGLEPSCVQHCVGGAIQYIDQADFQTITDGRHKLHIGKLCYISTKWKLSG